MAPAVALCAVLSRCHASSVKVQREGEWWLEALPTLSQIKAIDATHAVMLPEISGALTSSPPSALVQ
jgi:hypothetical protein